MHDEDTNEPMRCPHCGAEDSCPHLLAVIDQSFLACAGGYAYSRFDEFAQRIETAFVDRVEMDPAFKKVWPDDALQAMWVTASDEYASTNDIVLDGDLLFQLIIDLLFEAQGEEYAGQIDDDERPGSSSVTTVFYAKDPEQVFNRALRILATRLRE